MSASNTPEYEYDSAEYHTPDYLVGPVMDALARHGSKPLEILEIGCGNGYVAAMLAAAGHHVTAIDSSHTGINIARATYAQSGVRYEIVSVYDAAAFETFRNFDAVVSIEVVEHLQFPKAFFARAGEVLKPGGCVVLTTPYHGYWKNLALSLINRWDRHLAVDWDMGHLRFFSPRTLGTMAREAGFSEREWRGSGRIPGLWKSFIYEAEWRGR